MNTETSKLYLETSVISMYHDDLAPEFMEVINRQPWDFDPELAEITKSFWDEVLPNFNVFVSELTNYEIKQTWDPKLRAIFEDLIHDFTVLKETPEVLKLSDIYLSKKPNLKTDALHLAYASLGRMDYLVTWDYEHLYKRQTLEMINQVNLENKVAVPLITTPGDLFSMI
jgi:predicted nucleic acid-binding protein